MPTYSIRGAFVQPRIRFGHNEENIENGLELASRTKADLYVLPELCNTGYAFTSKEESQELSETLSGKTVEAIQSFTEKRKCTVVSGFAEKGADKVYNSSVIVERGNVLGTYRKMHLFYREKLWFSPSNDGFKVFDVDSLRCRVGILICFDWFFPEASRELALRGAEVICHPSNLVLPGKAQNGMLTRAFENRVFTITANRIGTENRGPKDKFRFTGKSQIVSPLMERLAFADATQVIAKSANLDLRLARNKNATSMNNIFEDRRVEYYQHLKPEKSRDL